MAEIAHEFLDYQGVDVHFIYSFEWRATDNFPQSVFTLGLTSQRDSSHGNAIGAMQETSPAPEESARWCTRPIHERPIFDPSSNRGPGVNSSQISADSQDLYSSYNPTFSVKRHTLMHEGPATNQCTAFVVVPFSHKGTTLFPSKLEFSEKANQFPDKLLWLDKDGKVSHQEPQDTPSEGAALVPITLFWTIRLFDSGIGITTLTVRRKNLATLRPERKNRYELLHWLLHLCPNTDCHPEPWMLEDEVEPTDSFLFFMNLDKLIEDGITAKSDEPSIKDDSGNNLLLTRLFDFGGAVTKNATNRFPTLKVARRNGAIEIAIDNRARAKSPIETHNDFLSKTKGFRPRHKYKQRAGRDSGQDYTEEWKYCNQFWEENQTPFIVTSIAVTPESMVDLKGNATSPHGQEVAALLVKLTLPNNRIKEDFRHLNFEYIAQYLNTRDRQLINMCLDDRVFFTMSRRGSLAISPAESPIPGNNNGRSPAYFVIPSLVNLCEILRTQSHGATALSWELTQMAINMRTCNPGDIDKVYTRYAELRRRLLVLLQNPVTHLFDGGSVSEVAEVARKLLMIDTAWEQVDRAFVAMDQYIRAVGSIWFATPTNEGGGQ